MQYHLSLRPVQTRICVSAYMAPVIQGMACLGYVNPKPNTAQICTLERLWLVVVVPRTL